MRKYSIGDMRRIAKTRGGLCLSKRYKNAHTKLIWKCKKGHIWKAVPLSVINQRTWCPRCSGRNKTIRDMQLLAKKKRGKCLSKKYLGYKTKLIWECKKGHIWKAIPDAISHGTWCPVCFHSRRGASQRLDLDKVKRFAKRKGLICLSGKYINNRTKMVWGCKKGHNWLASFDSIEHGSGCPHCAGLAKKSVKDMRELAKSAGLIFLSRKYLGDGVKHKWKCKAKGHMWEAVPSSIVQGTRCPECYAGFGENKCREIFQKIFKQKFPKRKPAWLLSVKGKKMELDGYCEKIGIAFEYQGAQHYKPIPIFNRTRDLKQQREYDKLKRRLCKKHGILLIEVPYIFVNKDMEGFIRKQLRLMKRLDVGKT